LLENSQFGVKNTSGNTFVGYSHKMPESTHEICMEYLEKHVAFVTVESVSNEVMKTVKDRRVQFTDQLATIGGTLGLFTGTSIISLIELFCLFFRISGKSLN